MRDPRYYGSGAEDWKVPDGGRWWARDTTFTEPNGDYLNFGFLSISGFRVVFNTGALSTQNTRSVPQPYDLSDIGFNDIANGFHHNTGQFYLVSTNAKP
jgi:hypothetical protein